MNRVLKEYNKYAESQGFNSDSIKKTILVTGHSRGGAIANLLGAYFEKEVIINHLHIHLLLHLLRQTR